MTCRLFTTSRAPWIVGSLFALAFTAARANAQVLLSDDFDDGDAVGWTEFDGSFAVVNGEYVITTSGFCNDGRAVAGDAGWTDYQVDVDFFVDSTAPGAHAALLFRVQEIVSGCDAGKYYQAYVYPDEVGFCRMNYSGGNCSILTTASVTTALQQWHHLAVNVDGTTATLSVDGIELLSYSGFTEYPAGRIGVKSVNTQTVRYDNVLVQGLPSGSWVDLGQALAGSAGEPILDASGELVPASPVTLSLSQAAPFSLAILVIGATDLSAGFKGGVLVPYPNLLIPALTDGFGALLFGGPWPSGVSSGSSLWLQFWISDAAGPKGYAASNAVRADVP